MRALVGIAMLMYVVSDFSEQLLLLIRHPNLVTISSLSNSHPETMRINAIGAKFYQLITSIHTSAQLRSRKAQETSLYTGVEKGLLGGKGIFTKPNALSAAAFEILLAKDARRGKILWYADTLFSNARGLLIWSIREDATFYTLRELNADARCEERLELFRDGRGEYERYEGGRLVRKLRWRQHGEIELEE
ncbi:MAG: hypothetical protein ACK41G_10120 [Candidatus Thermochlorobacter sp.]